MPYATRVPCAEPQGYQRASAAVASRLLPHTRFPARASALLRCPASYPVSGTPPPHAMHPHVVLVHHSSSAEGAACAHREADRTMTRASPQPLPPRYPLMPCQRPPAVPAGATSSKQGPTPAPPGLPPALPHPSARRPGRPRHPSTRPRGGQGPAHGPGRADGCWPVCACGLPRAKKVRQAAPQLRPDASASVPACAPPFVARRACRAPPVSGQ